jgi:hypothetical protein
LYRAADGAGRARRLALAISSAVAIFVGGKYPQLVVFKEMFTGIDSFPLMAVPFFILAAELMSGGALTHVLLRFAAQFVGHLRGGLGYANVGSSMLFSGISGSALADAAGPGCDDGQDDAKGRLRPPLRGSPVGQRRHHGTHHPAVDQHDHLRAAG